VPENDKQNITACLVVTWNSSTFLENSIGRLQAFAAPADIWVVDNGSSDGTPDRIRTSYPGVNLISLPVNTGFAGGNNCGMKAILAAGYRNIFLLNADTIVDEDILTRCNSILADNPNVGIAGPTILEAEPPGIIQSEGGRIRAWTLNFEYFRRGEVFHRRDEIVDVGYVLGAGMMIRRGVIAEIGYFDEDYYPAYVEEADLCHRARKAGWRCVVDRGSALRHIGEQSSGGALKAFDRLSVRRFYFGIKHLGPFTFALAAALVVARVFFWKCRFSLGMGPGVPLKRPAGAP